MGFVGQVLIHNYQKFVTLQTVPEALRCVAVPARIKMHLLQAAFNTLNYKAEQLGLLYHIWPGVLGAKVGLGAALMMGLATLLSSLQCRQQPSCAFWTPAFCLRSSLPWTKGMHRGGVLCNCVCTDPEPLYLEFGGLPCARGEAACGWGVSSDSATRVGF